MEMQSCPTCGAKLPPTAAFCPFCGAALVAAPTTSAVPADNSALPVTGITPPAAGVQAESRAEQPSYGQYQPGLLSYPAQQAPAPPSTPASHYPTPYIPAQQPFYNVPPAPYSAPPAPTTPPSTNQKPRRLPLAVTILLISLALLSILSGVALLFYSTVYHPAQLAAEVTATVQARSTTDARATATANAQATSTAIAFANATATAQAQLTAQAVATTTAQQNIYSSATRGTPVLNDSLSFNTSNNWDVFSDSGGGCAFSGGAFHASVNKQNFYVPCFAETPSFSNCAFQVQMRITQGDIGGLVLRANATAAKFYLFFIGRDSTYNIALAQDSTHSKSLAFGNSPAINTSLNAGNLITVIARGSSLYLYINKQYVAHVSDTTYTSGAIGVMATDEQHTTDVAFTNAKVWQL